jgi:hypothetical protein
MLEDKYNKINDAGKKQLARHGIIGANFDLIKDPRRSLDINYDLPASCKDAINKKITKPLEELFNSLEVSQIIFPNSWLHMTLFTILSASTRKPTSFFLEDKNRMATEVIPYKKVFEETILLAKPFEITFNRLILAPGASDMPGCIFLAGIPKNNEIEKNRKRIKALLKKEGLETSQESISDIFHITVARWQNNVPCEKVGKILNFLEKIDGNEIWKGTMERVIFASGGYIMTKEKTVIFSEVELGNRN